MSRVNSGSARICWRNKLSLQQLVTVCHLIGQKGFTMSIGFVSLVGAGPGDPELITVKGLRRLRAADVVIYDALANEALLHECRADAELIYAGKRAGQHYRSQDEINALLVEKACAGLQVVRLKGGD